MSFSRGFQRDRGALLSPCKRFRYILWRRWGEGGLPLVFVMLNPSTADAESDDPTVRKCVGFARLLGFGAIEVVNLFAYRAADPAELRRAGYPRSKHEDSYIERACGPAGRPVVCAWGAHARGLTRPQEVIRIARERGARAMVLARTADGVPRHPLMLPYKNAELRPY